MGARKKYLPLTLEEHKMLGEDLINLNKVIDATGKMIKERAPTAVARKWYSISMGLDRARHGLWWLAVKTYETDSNMKEIRRLYYEE